MQWAYNSETIWCSCSRTRSHRAGNVSMLQSYKPRVADARCLFRYAKISGRRLFFLDVLSTKIAPLFACLSAIFMTPNHRGRFHVRWKNIGAKIPTNVQILSLEKWQSWNAGYVSVNPRNPPFYFNESSAKEPRGYHLNPKTYVNCSLNDERFRISLRPAFFSPVTSKQIFTKHLTHSSRLYT